jgi:methionyl-tRNA formyltransferase
MRHIDRPDDLKKWFDVTATIVDVNAKTSEIEMRVRAFDPTHAIVVCYQKLRRQINAAVKVNSAKPAGRDRDLSVPL